VGVDADDQTLISLSSEEAEFKARSILRLEVCEFISGGAGDGFTIRANVAAWSEWYSRVLADVSSRTTNTEILGA
jgi:isopentenyl diphosphate isomerase/L-lactate dehydrogenase-like FMN-dependent dehydrogenase